MPSRLTAVDQGILIGYFLAVTAFGAYFVRRSRTTRGFMVASGRLPAWAVAFSIVGTFVSSVTFLAYPGYSYAGNWDAFIFSLTLPFAAFVAVRWFIPLYRRLGGISAYAYLEHRFGPWARIFGSASYILFSLFRIGMILYLVSLALHEFTGWDPAAIIVATGALVTLYTILGGMEAVVWTDVVQVVILVGGALLSLGLILARMPEGPGQVVAIAARDGKLSLGSWRFDLVAPTAWVVLFFGIMENLRNFGVDQAYVQRYQTVRTEREAVRSVWAAALGYIPISALFLLIGTALYAYYEARPGLLPAEIAASESGDRVFPYFIVTQLPEGVRGVLVAAVFAAAMSSIDSSLNCVATLTLLDFYKRYLRPDAGEWRSLWAVRSFTLFWGTAGTGVGLRLIGIKRALTTGWMLSGIAGGGVIGLFLLGLCLRWIRPWVAAAAVAASVASIAWATFARDLPGSWSWLACTWEPRMIGVIGAGTLLAVGIVLGLADRGLAGARCRGPGRRDGKDRAR